MMNEQGKLIWIGAYGSGTSCVVVEDGKLRWTHVALHQPQCWEVELPREGEVAAVGAGPCLLFSDGELWMWAPWQWRLLSADMLNVAPTLQPAPPPIPPVSKAGAR